MFPVAHTGFSCRYVPCVKAALSQSSGQGQQQGCAQRENIGVGQAVCRHGCVPTWYVLRVAHLSGFITMKGTSIITEIQWNWFVLKDVYRKNQAFLS